MIEKYINEICKNAPIGLAVLSLNDYIIIDANEALSKMLKVPLDKIKGKPCYEVFHNFLIHCPLDNCPVEKIKEGNDSFETMHFHGAFKETPVYIKSVKLNDEYAIIYYHLEEELHKQTQELEALHYISTLVHRSLSIEEVVHTILTAVTSHQGLGFHRAFILLQKEDYLEGAFAVGPINADEASRIWSEIKGKDISLLSILQNFDKNAFESAPITKLVKNLKISLQDEKDLIIWAYSQNIILNLTRDKIPEGLSFKSLDYLNAKRAVLIPLNSAMGNIGILIADHAFSSEPIDEKLIKSLNAFAQEATSALVNSMMFENLEEKTKALEDALKSLKESRERLVNAERLSAIGELSAQIAHEIRNPLVTIGMLASKIRKIKNLGEKDQKKVEAMEKEIRRLERLLQDLLSFSSQPKPKFKPINLKETIQDLIFFMEDEFSERGINIKTYFQENIPPCKADPDQIRHVFLNLFRNAMNVLPKGGEVVIEAFQIDDNWERISVKDNGPGIPAKFKEKIFEPFFSTSSIGSGLGLAIASKIVKEHQGQLYVESEEGEGTTFFIELPIFKGGENEA
jgi:signal transduction histidine kinase